MPKLADLEPAVRKVTHQWGIFEYKSPLSRGQLCLGRLVGCTDILAQTSGRCEIDIRSRFSFFHLTRVCRKHVRRREEREEFGQVLLCRPSATDHSASCKFNMAGVTYSLPFEVVGV